jgi:predicted DNA-binding protein YlxM (UPF0122 family)
MDACIVCYHQTKQNCEIFIGVLCLLNFNILNDNNNSSLVKERKKRVIDLYFNQHKSYAEIAQIEKISPRDIHTIVKEEDARRQKHKDQQQQEERILLL